MPRDADDDLCGNSERSIPSFTNNEDPAKEKKKAELRAANGNDLHRPGGIFQLLRYSASDVHIKEKRIRYTCANT